MQKIAFVSTCGAGHLNTLQSLWDTHVSSHLFLLRFKDDPLPFQETDRLTVLTLNEKRPSEVASEFNRVRSKGLVNTLHIWMYDFAPTLIVYDFFCVEARHVSREMGIPAICSIPATLKNDETSTCSDAFLHPEHFYWVWRQPYQVAIRPVAFLGPRRQDPCLRTRTFTLCYQCWENVVIVTFGTVVPKYDGCKERLGRIMVQIDQLAQMHPETLFVFAGIDEPQKRDNCASGKDLHVPTLLTEKVTVVLFHGGGNTFSEALQARIPYFLACPFFGDQFETARQCGNVYSGDLIDDFTHLQPYSYDNVQIAHPFQDTIVDYWTNGDLLFGHRRHRDSLQVSFPMMNFHLNHYAKFATFANPIHDLPAIADVYNDELAHSCDDDDDSTEYGRRLSDVAFARKSFPCDHLPEEHRLVHYCIQMMRLIHSKWKGRIHFVLGPLDELGIATNLELDEIRNDWHTYKDIVIFYNLQGKRIPAPLVRPTKKYHTSTTAALQHDSVSTPIVEIAGRMPLVWGRTKTLESIHEKMACRKLFVYDKIGWRTGYLNRDDLELVLNHVDQSFTVSVNWCKQRVWHFEYHSIETELQVWPWIYLYCFYMNMAGIETDRDYQHQVYELIKDTMF